MQTISALSATRRPVPAVIPSTFATSGKLVVRLAESPAEIAAAQALRYRVFYEEMRALPSAEMLARRQDFDSFDPVCDHLLVVDADRPTGEEVVGTYRLIRQEIARAHGGFYSSSEYDLSPLTDNNPGARFLELGRSCVDPAYRSNATIQLLWRGITGYVLAHRIDFMFGCGSLSGVDAEGLALPLSYLHHEFLAPPELRVRAHANLYTEMNRMARTDINPRAALRALPPLIKGYLRLGAQVLGAPAWDPDFNTADLPMLMRIADLPARYRKHFLGR